MALHREDLSAEELSRQAELDRSWALAQRDLNDPPFRAYLEASLRRLDSEGPAPMLTAEEFLARTELTGE